MEKGNDDGSQPYRDGPFKRGPCRQGAIALASRKIVMDKIDPDTFRHGMRHEIMSLAAYRSDPTNHFMPSMPNEDQCVALVITGTTPEAVCLVVDLSTGEMPWINPANEAGVTEAYRDAVLALGRAETAQKTAYGPRCKTCWGLSVTNPCSGCRENKAHGYGPTDEGKPCETARDLEDKAHAV